MGSRLAEVGSGLLLRNPLYGFLAGSLLIDSAMGSRLAEVGSGLLLRNPWYGFLAGALLTD